MKKKRKKIIFGARLDMSPHLLGWVRGVGKQGRYLSLVVGKVHVWPFVVI